MDIILYTTILIIISNIVCVLLGWFLGIFSSKMGKVVAKINCYENPNEETEICITNCINKTEYHHYCVNFEIYNNRPIPSGITDIKFWTKTRYHYKFIRISSPPFRIQENYEDMKFFLNIAPYTVISKELHISGAYEIHRDTRIKLYCSYRTYDKRKKKTTVLLKYGNYRSLRRQKNNQSR